MQRKRLAVLVPLLLSLLVPGTLVLASHGGTADLGSHPFSNPLRLNPPNYLTCIIGNHEGYTPPLDGEDPFGGGGESGIGLPPPPAGGKAEHWKVLSRGPAGMTPGTLHEVQLLVGAASVNVLEEAGKVRATVVDESGVKSIEVVHPLTFDGDTNVMSLTLSILAGEIYDLTIENLPESPFSLKRVAKHYKLGAVQPYVELGYGSPALEYIEGGIKRWAINVAPGEQVEFLISVDDESGSPPPPGVPPQATEIEYRVGEPGVGIIAGPVVAAISPLSPVVINFSNPYAQVKTYVVVVLANGHHKMEKLSGPDRGLYALECQGGPPPPPPRPVDIDVKPGSWPNSVNVNGNGVVPIGVFGGLNLDVSDIDVSTVLAGVTGIEASPVHGGHIEDINEDGIDDIIFHFREAELGIPTDTPGNTEMPLFLTAALDDGGRIRGVDIIRITPNDDQSRGKGGKGPK